MTSQLLWVLFQAKLPNVCWVQLFAFLLCEDLLAFLYVAVNETSFGLGLFGQNKRFAVIALGSSKLWFFLLYFSYFSSGYLYILLRLRPSIICICCCRCCFTHNFWYVYTLYPCYFSVLEHLNCRLFVYIYDPWLPALNSTWILNYSCCWPCCLC